ncbi:hypothetical protein Btru_015952 [Bulinus truncatus]|nr:hypothetical protein Btru_015952 [Bulinus truncatus]
MSYCLVTISSLVLCLALVHLTEGQNYHFSNGWYAGRKRSAPSYNSVHTVLDSLSKTPPDDSCNVRPEAILLINKIIQEEVSRIQKVCTSDTTSGFRELLENTESK